ncbi:hypothetical protein PspLS_08537 [Pyricularia sp. CBS 133598]|nr:hypothetical protein PspLS_08537 [Pyricularia sp. CBS 133598]
MASASRQLLRAASRASTRTAFAPAASRGLAARTIAGRRFYSSSSSEPAKASSSNLGWIAGALAAAAAGAGYWYTQNGAAAPLTKPEFKHYQAVYNDIASRLEENPDYDDGSYGPVLVRLAWHASGTYDKETGTGGSNGATMRFSPEGNHGANAGLKAARDFLEPIKAKYPWITYSDLWILGGVCAIQEMLGPKIPYRPGRSDKDAAACTPDGRLPDAAQRQDHVRNIFYRMGFNDQEIVALAGAHALGRCHTDRSGFDGPWTFSPTVLTNDYFKLLLNEKWEYKKWDGPKQYVDSKTKTLMMLPADMCLIEDKKFKEWTKKYADDNDLFFKDFSAAVLKLFELGVPFAQGTENQRWTFKSTSE